MQIAYKTEQVKAGSRGARVRSPKKCLPKGWRTRRLPALANQEPASRESLSGDTLQ